MYMINHSLNIDILGAFLSDPAQASTTNGVTSCVRVSLCSPTRNDLMHHMCSVSWHMRTGAHGWEETGGPLSCCWTS